VTDRLRVVPKPGEPPVFHFTLDDLDELAGFVAAEANHAKERNYRRSWTSSATAFKLLWTATRTRTIGFKLPLLRPCRTSTLAIPAHQSSAPVYMERWVHRTNTKIPVVVIHTRVNCAGYEFALPVDRPTLARRECLLRVSPVLSSVPTIPQEDTFRRGHKGRSSLLTITSSLSQILEE